MTKSRKEEYMRIAEILTKEIRGFLERERLRRERAKKSKIRY